MALSSLPSVDLSENRQPNLYASSTIPFFFALVSVALRFWCRWINRAGFWLDDWLILFALVCAVGLTATLLWDTVPRGLGRHVQTFDPNVNELFSIGLFTAELTYTGVIVFVKFSILTLYWRIFNKTNIKLPISILAVTVLMWGIAVFLLTLLQCIPTRGFWNKTVEASCDVDSQKFLFAISIPNILIDVTLLTLPIPYVIRLNVSKSQKRAIVSMFLLGGFVCIASIMRLVAVVTEGTDADITWNLVNQGIWAVVEADFAIISACLPTLRPIWIAIRPKHFATMPATQPPYPPPSGTPQKRTQPSWATSILKSSNYDEEDTRPFSKVDGNAEDGLHREFVPEPEAIAIPLRDVRTKETQELGAIRVENAWEVEYSQREYSRGRT
ncbi:hypothetical protein F4677DRAFT_465074 [Hypoxylon crocopeplum]|nr:hypothetical protein F4677DRAFT_465074 [Hypoxylon crocopeplum]